MSKPFGVGIIGASAERGWAKISHVPAIQSLTGLELAAVATNDQRSADAAAKAFGVPGYADATALSRDPAIDIIAVAVNVPAHPELVLGALKAGNHLYYELPLGRDLAEAEELAAAARTARAHAAIGLQTRQNPAVGRARELLDEGANGRVLSANVLSTAMAFGPEVEPAMAFGERVENGTTFVSIQGGHTIDLALALLGEVRDVVALATTQYAVVRVGDDPAPEPRPTPDHILIQARLESGAPLAVGVAGGRPPKDEPFRFKVIGERGSLVWEGHAPRGFQSSRLRLLLNGEEQPNNEGEATRMIDTATNVAGVYARLRDDMLESSRTGQRKSATDWLRP